MSLVVVRALGLVTVQDLGRPGRMHEAVPVGGALVRERLIAANRAVQNPDDAAALEVLGALVIRAERDVHVATDTTATRSLRAGDEISIASEPNRVTYLALRGGLDVPVMFGGRGALLCAGLGGLVRAGQRFASAGLPAIGAQRTVMLDGDAGVAQPIRLIAGPDREHFTGDALHILTSSDYRVLPSSNRVGTRLDGPALPRSDAPEVSRPMVIGAIEVPRDGKPIVLGPEHPTTGGYPVIAVVAHADLGRLFSRKLGGALRFTVDDSGTL